MIGAYDDVVIQQLQSVEADLSAGIIPTLLNATTIPANDTSILMKVGIASTDVANSIYSSLSSNSTIGTYLQGSLQALYAVAGVSAMK